MTILKQILPLLSKYKKKIVTSLAIFFTVFFFWLFFIHYNNTHHVSVARNFFTGKLKMDSTAGIKFSAPWVQVIKFDTRPFKVCVDCSCANVNCKLIAFDPNGWADFLNREGFNYFWFKNRISFNSGQSIEYRGIRHVLRGYAFDVKYSFIKQLDEV
jgi:hypothetical protein